MKNYEEFLQNIRIEKDLKTIDDAIIYLICFYTDGGKFTKKKCTGCNNHFDATPNNFYVRYASEKVVFRSRCRGCGKSKINKNTFNEIMENKGVKKQWKS